MYACGGESVWNLLVFGLERLAADIASDAMNCHCVIDSAFWLLTKQEKCVEVCKLAIALLNCSHIT